MEEKRIHARISRYSPKVRLKRVDTFKVPHRLGMTVQTMLRYIFENRDPTLAFRDFRCGRGICNTCLVKLNGKVVRSCETTIQPGEEILIEPATDRIIKDLVIEAD